MILSVTLATKQYKPSIVHHKVLVTITCKHKLSVLSDKIMVL